MSERNEAGLDRQIANTARAYRRRGYHVQVRPGRDHLPAFLGDFQPDLLAEKDGEKVVVEVKSRRMLTGSNDLVELADRIAEQDGWRLDLAVVNPPDDGESVRALTGQLSQIVREADKASRAGATTAALSLVVGFIETLVYAFARRFNRNTERESVTCLLTELTFHGVIGRELFEEIQSLRSTHARLMHGRSDEAPPSRENLARVIQSLGEAFLASRP